MAHIPENILEDILSRINIAEIISGYIPLKRAGKNFKANCPFHHEKTPSFMVSPDRQIYHCFGCGESGNAFKFLMRYERLEFPEAVEALAKKAGVILPAIEDSDNRTASLYTQLYKLNELALSFYEHNLNSKEGLSARDYLLKRGLNENTLKLFKLGFAPDNWDALLNHLRAKNIPLSLLEKAGLVIAKSGGGYYDRFRKRIIFPIFDIKSRPIGFGARVLDDSLPKYINSPETPVYIKGKNLYGLNLAKDAIRQNDCAVVVEGYLDFIMPFQQGLQNIAASLGTALTQEQVRLLKRYARNVIMVYDPDTAGEIATLRTLDIFIEEEVNVKVVPLSERLDPDSFVRKNGIDSFREKINNAENLFDYKLKILKSRYSAKEIEGKAKISSEMLVTIKKFNDAVLKSEYVKKLAEELNVKEDALIEELNKIKSGAADPSLIKPQHKQPLNINPAEKLLVKLMLEETGLIDYVKERLAATDFSDEVAHKIVSAMFSVSAEGKSIDRAVLINRLRDEDSVQLICESVFSPEVSEQHKEKIVDGCIERLKSEKLKLKKQHLHNEIKQAQHSGDEKEINRLMQEFHLLIKEGARRI